MQWYRYVSSLLKIVCLYYCDLNLAIWGINGGRIIKKYKAADCILGWTDIHELKIYGRVC